jgi:DNA-binding helix-hairpin-helix protein with protein kinase domain
MKDENGKLVSFQGEPINSGGEGKIYKTDWIGFVAKVYDVLPNSDQITKLKAMIANPPKNPPTNGNYVAIAWPSSLLFEKDKCIGFLMPQIGKNVQLIEVYNPKRRKAVLPKCDWVFLHTAARNFAEIVNSLHKTDYVIGDIKPQNILVDNHALVSVVDTDSFQVRTGNTVYRCHVATEGFTPPELLGVDTSNVTQTVYHDRYRIALIIYHLLFTRHPFDEGKWQGSGEQPSQVELIKQGVWLYNSQGLLQSHKVTIPLQVIHPNLQRLFQQCFNAGHKEPTKRPSAEEWSEALRLAINDLTSCGKVDTHKFSRIYGNCYWCERKGLLNNLDIFEGEPPKPKIKTIPRSRKTVFPPSSPPTKNQPVSPAPLTNQTPTPPQTTKSDSNLDPKDKKIIGGGLLLMAGVCFVVGYASWGIVVGIFLLIYGFSFWSNS